jgi:hypothetical protein
VLEEFARFSICGGGFDDSDSINDRGELEPIQLMGYLWRSCS